jgi:molybdopterin/thiamine biosynthesis adenylyltransferase
MESLTGFLASSGVDGLISWQAQQEAAKRFALSLREVEAAILEKGLLPARYRRNGCTISLSQQKILCRSKVAVIGCGGLGGYVLEGLARLGVGHLLAVDYDTFEEHNLNRQLLATPETLGRFKADVACERLHAVNPAIEATGIKAALTAENAAHILAGCGAVVDALDSVSARLTLAAACGELGIPLVHGAICGWYGQAATQYPGDGLLEKLYASAEADKGLETVWGNPSFTPAVVAGLQVAETCKVLLAVGSPLQKRLLHLNLLDMELEEIHL